MTTVQTHRDNLRSSANLLLAAGYLLWHSSRQGGQQPWQMKIWERMEEPQPGDIVIPRDSELHNALVGHEVQKVGILIRIEKHYPKSEEQRKTVPHRLWEQMEPHLTTRVIILERIFDGELEIRPYHGGMLALPDNPIPLISGYTPENSPIIRQILEEDVAERQGRARDAYNNHLDSLRMIPEPYAGGQ